jgi:hypothetical protein
MAMNTQAPRDPGFFTEVLESRDPEIFGAIRNELGRQRDEIELIASENIVSAAVLEARPWRSNAPRNCLAAASPMCSRIRAAR